MRRPMQTYQTTRCDDHDVISARTGPDATFNKKSSPLSSLTIKLDDLNRHFRFRTHPILDPILTHPVLKSGGFTRIRVGRCKIGSKIGWGDPIFHPILDPILLLKPSSIRFHPDRTDITPRVVVANLRKDIRCVSTG